MSRCGTSMASRFTDAPGTMTVVWNALFPTAKWSLRAKRISVDRSKFSPTRAITIRLDIGMSPRFFPTLPLSRYEWLPYDTVEKQEKHRELVRCGNSAPVLMKCADGQERIGFLDLGTEVALVAYNGKSEKVEGGACKKLMTIFRNLNPPPTGLMVYDDLWYDIKYGDAFPKNAVPADDRQLSTDTGPMFQYVALWYKHGEPVFGRAYPTEAGKTAAHFGRNNQENTGPEVGSMQLLTVPERSCMGQEYKWMTLAEGKTGGWTTVHVGDAVPCILKGSDGKEVLGNLDLKTEKASAGWAGKEKVIQGGAVTSLKVLFKRRIA